MMNKKEIIVFVLTLLVLSFTISMFDIRNLFLTSLIYISIILFTNVLAKKATAHFLDSEIEIKTWEIRRFGFKKHLTSKRPFAIGVFLPIILKLITAGFLNWMATMVFDVKAKVYRAAKRHGLYAFTEMSEAQIGAIAASGIIMSILISVLGYFAGFQDFAKLSIWFAFFNIIPISNLDGNKIFFGSVLLWTILATIILIGALATIFIV
ncbi:hypothetical protein B6U91_00420 [Candidatus Pacearchaeota archaeon ex4484_71]|nr:MAG: hypothetical protein B6U91_00420 [Candidatus Pacearchaeota archaeon ex4484_71]